MDRILRSRIEVGLFQSASVRFDVILWECTQVALGVWIRDARCSHKRAREDVTKSLTILDKHLFKNTYMVGDQVGLCSESDGTCFV